MQQFFGWLAAEEEVDADPMARMKPPLVPEQPADMLTDDQPRAVLAVCEGRGFVDRREPAVVRLFVDTGMRLAELAGLTVTDIDLDVNSVAHVTGKGRRARACPFGRETVQELDRYLCGSGHGTRGPQTPPCGSGSGGKGR